MQQPSQWPWALNYDALPTPYLGREQVVDLRSQVSNNTSATSGQTFRIKLADLVHVLRHMTFVLLLTI